MAGNSPNPTLFVEFVGLPGSGKTTIRRRLVKLLSDAGYPVSVVLGEGRRREAPPQNRLGSAVDRVTNRLASVPCAFGETRYWMSWRIRGGHSPYRLTDAGFLRKRIGTSIRRKSAYRKWRRVPGIQVFDGGVFVDVVVKLLHRNAAGAPTVLEMERLTRRFTAPQLLVVVQARAETLARRLKHRERLGTFSSRIAADVARLDDLAAAMSAVEPRLADLAKARPKFWCKFVDNEVGGEDSLDVKVAELAHLVRRLYDRGDVGGRERR